MIFNIKKQLLGRIKPQWGFEGELLLVMFETDKAAPRYD